MILELEGITEEEFKMLGLLKDLENLEEGDFENLNEKVEGFIRGSYETEYSFDVEKFSACLESLKGKGYIRCSKNDGEGELHIKVDDISPAGLELLEKMEKAANETAATKNEKVELSNGDKFTYKKINGEKILRLTTAALNVVASIINFTSRK